MLKDAGLEVTTSTRLTRARRHDPGCKRKLSTSAAEMVLVLLVPQGRTWSHQEGLQPLGPALCTGTRSQQYGWILNAKTQDLSSLNTTHQKASKTTASQTSSYTKYTPSTPVRYSKDPSYSYTEEIWRGRATGSSIQDLIPNFSPYKLFIPIILIADKKFQSPFEDKDLQHCNCRARIHRR